LAALLLPMSRTMRVRFWISLKITSNSERLLMAGGIGHGRVVICTHFLFSFALS
jgi:hypothetical protein